MNIILTQNQELIISGDFSIDLLNQKSKGFQTLICSYRIDINIEENIGIIQNTRSHIDNLTNISQYDNNKGVIDSPASDKLM